MGLECVVWMEKRGRTICIHSHQIISIWVSSCANVFQSLYMYLIRIWCCCAAFGDNFPPKSHRKYANKFRWFYATIPFLFIILLLFSSCAYVVSFRFFIVLFSFYSYFPFTFFNYFHLYLFSFYLFSILQARRSLFRLVSFLVLIHVLLHHKVYVLHQHVRLHNIFMLS